MNVIFIKTIETKAVASSIESNIIISKKDEEKDYLTVVKWMPKRPVSSYTVLNAENNWIE